MGRSGKNTLSYGVLPHFKALPWYAEHYIQIDVFEPGFLSLLERVERIVLAVYPAQRLEYRVFERLNPYTETVYPLSQIHVHLFI